MKICCLCKEEKELSVFYKNARRKDGHESYCKSCAIIKNREYYLKTPERNVQRRASMAAKVKLANEFVWNYLLTHACVDCKESDTIVLEFDHVSGEKKFSISQAIRSGYSISLITEEIAKCEVRCANCHRRITAKRGKYFRYLKVLDNQEN